MNADPAVFGTVSAQGSADPETLTEETQATPGVWILLASIPLLLGVLLQRFGEITYLTRLDRVFDPITNMARGFDLWNPYWDMGAVQYQQNGYWIPFDLWFGFAKFLHLPLWLSERLFSGSLIVLALWGFVRLADALKIGVPLSRVFGGLAFAISPVILSRIGWQSPFAMGVVFLPWALLPLVRGANGSSTRRAAALSALAIALMGGANAAVTLALLPAPVLYLLTRSRGPRRASLIRWWSVLVPMATLWWIVMLSFFARYSPNTLAYTESSRATVSPTPIFDVLRGTADWVARLPGPQNPAGFELSLRVVPMVATAIVAALGIAGLARRKLPEKTFLLLTFFIGVAAVGGGFGGLFGNPASSVYVGLLDGPLNAFRNIYKFQGLIALPVALGTAHLLSAVLPRERLRNALSAKGLISLVLLGVIAVAASPLWNNTLTRGPGFSEIPQAWIDANEWLSENSAGRTLILPGIPEGDFDWGYTSQIPLQWGSNTTWAVRSQAPLSGVDVIEYLDATEVAMETGGDSGLPEYLRRGGFTAIVVPNDQRSEQNGAPPPETIRNALVASGFERVAGFGKRNYGYGQLQQVEIYAVPGGAVAASYPASSTTWMSGGIASTLSIPTRIFGDRPYLLSRGTSTSPIDPEQWIVTDGNQASTVDYGLNRDNRSYIHGVADDVVPEGQYPEDRTTQELPGFASVTASSVGPGIIRSNLPQFDPATLLDGDPSTWWMPFRAQVDGPDAWGSIDPYVDISFRSPSFVDHLDISLYLGPYAQDAPIEITVRTDAGTRTSQVLAETSPQPIEVAPGLTSSIRLSIARSSFAATDDAIGIRELSLPGSPVSARLIVPSQLTDKFKVPGTPDPAWVFTRNRPATSPLSSLATEKQILRNFTVPKGALFNSIVTRASARGQKLLNWLGTTPTLAIAAESTWGENPKVGPRNLIDGSASTLWRSGSDITDEGGSTRIFMRWNTERSISSLRLMPTDFDAMPTDVVITAGSETRSAPVRPDGTVDFIPLSTYSLSLTMNYAPVPLDDESTPRHMGFSAIEVPALLDLYPGPVDRAAPYIASCGSGPTVAIGTTKTLYSLTATTGELIDGAPLSLTTCGSEGVNLPAGPTTLDTSSGESFVTIDQIVIGNSPTMARPTGTPRSVRVDHWGTNDRTVTVASGTEGLLVVNEAFNEGWEAEIDGTKLQSLTIDGWRQAFLIPAGSGGVIHLRFVADRYFKAATAFGLFTLLVVGVLALWPVRKKREIPVLHEGKAAAPLLLASVIIGAVWCTGLGALLVLPLWWVRNHRRNWLTPIAFTTMTAAGVLAVAGKRIVDSPSEFWGVASYPVSALAATAFLCALITLLPRRRTTRSDSP